jgi:nucleotide-binding universal stress UspA family protein
MADSSDTFNIVVGLDYSESSALALRYALSTAAARRRSHLHVVHVVQPTGPLPSRANGPVEPGPPDGIDALRRYVENALGERREQQASNETPPSETISLHVRTESPAQAIVQLASDLTADMVVVGTHGRHGIARFLLGSVAEEVVRKAPCPVLVVRPTGAAAEGVVVEPPCPDCAAVRRESGGTKLWCATHAEHHGRPHTYRFAPVNGAHQSGLLIRVNQP